ncbi:MAG: asparagine synthetase B, partial [Gammaproteobacteria bacterium]|nr:asparagine synthetase B [Gammaproteobacteria bacterium]
MSGIVGIVHLDGSPVDRQLLSHMTHFLHDSGPDATETKLNGHVGFGHTLLRTTVESEHERQPVSLDGLTWITADARLDGRADLILKLSSQNRPIPIDVDDPTLLLHAYHVWGEHCLDHLLGDYAFAIWDGKHRRLFCARDQLGVKPFFYLCKDKRLVFSNSLECLRLHPSASDILNDLAIADFLLFSTNLDPNTTAFKDINRLAPGHLLLNHGDRLERRRYWDPPLGNRIRYRKGNEYVEQFKEIFTHAVDDRLRGNRVGVFMS